MDEITKSIYDSYKSGRYFSDALEWYSLKYIYPAIQRLSFVFYITLFIFTSLILFNTGNQISATPEKFVYVVNFADSIKNKARITELDHPISSELAVANFLLTQYVTKYESYDYFDIPKQFEYIKNNSTREVMLDFYHKMDLANDQSPILKFQKHSVITIENINIGFQDYFNKEQNSAIISFNKVIYSKITKTTKTERVKILVTYELSDLEKVINKEKSLIFRIKEYTIINS